MVSNSLWHSDENKEGVFKMNNIIKEKANELPLLSIVIPVYNAANYINACWDSLKQQTYPNMEYVFVDDCSKDESLNLLKAIQLTDLRVHVYQTNKNSGVSEARNVGIDRSTGELIGFCDADDTCDLNMFKCMVEAMLSHNAQISCCGLRRIKPDGTVISVLWDAPAGKEFDSEYALKAWLMGEYIGNSVYTKVFRRELWNGIRFPKGEIFEESYVIPQLFHAADRIVHTGLISYNYYHREGTYTTREFNESKLIVYDREKYIGNFINKYYPGLTDAFNTFLIRQNTALMMGIEMSNRDKKSAIYKKVRSEFDSVFVRGLKSKELRIKKKIQLIELYTGLFHFRKSMKREDAR